MSLTSKKIGEISDDLSEQLRLLAAEHPANGKLKVLFRNVLNEAFGGMGRRMAVQHLQAAHKALQNGDAMGAMWHLGAAAMLRSDSEFKAAYLDHFNVAMANAPAEAAPGATDGRTQEQQHGEVGSNATPGAPVQDEAGVLTADDAETRPGSGVRFGAGATRNHRGRDKSLRNPG